MVAEFRVLGAVEMSVDGKSVELGHGRQLCVLAGLLVEADDPVSTDELIWRAWGSRLPRRARDTLYCYLSRLRRALAATDDVDLVRRSGGYVLTFNEAGVDLYRFRRLISEGRAADHDDSAVALFEEAFKLWRGEPFRGLNAPWLNTVRDNLRQELFAAELDNADRRLRRGEDSSLVPELSARAVARPLDERLAGQLMLALYRCGRQADALRHYQVTRLRLAEELGADPSPPLRELHRQILTADAALTVPTVPRRAGHVGRTAPFGSTPIVRMTARGAGRADHGSR